MGWKVIVNEHRGQSGAHDLRNTTWNWSSAVDRRTRWWSKRREANGVVVRRKHALSVQLAQSEHRSSDVDDFTEAGIRGHKF